MRHLGLVSPFYIYTGAYLTNGVLFIGHIADKRSFRLWYTGVKGHVSVNARLHCY